MASPPYSHSPTALSPPSVPQLPPLSIGNMNSKKRASDGVSSPALKRRKASTISVNSAHSAHPLRQTSFPPDEVGTPLNARSPSVDSMSLVSGSQVSAAAVPRKKRGRKSKAEKAAEKTPSLVGGTRAHSVATGVSDGARGSKSAAGGAGADDEGEEADGPTEVAITLDERTKEQKAEEHRLRAMLSTALSSEQFERYELYRASGLVRSAVKRLVNATVSQSVTDPIVIGLRGVAKVFIGDIVESARRIQGEWIANTGEKQREINTPTRAAEYTNYNTMQNPGMQGSYQNPLQNDVEQAMAKIDEDDDRRAPLRPEHLREALRRYLLSYEGSGVGMQGVWHQQQQNGVERFPSRTAGRRIFR